MRFLRENLFFAILLGVTVLVGAGGLVYYLLSDVGNQIKSRQGLSTSLRRLRERPAKVNENIVTALRERIEASRAAAQKDANDAIEFNRRNLAILQLQVTPTRVRPAFPVDPVEYNNEGLYLVFIRQYTQSLNAMLAQPALHRTTVPTNEEIVQRAAQLQEAFKEKAQQQARVEMMLQKAKAGLVYIDDDAVDRYFAEETTAPDTRLWESQINLWVTQEVLRAIAATNQEVTERRLKTGLPGETASVLNSAVKHLLKINVTERLQPPLGMAGARVVGSDLTQRSTTGDYVLVPYNFRVAMPYRYVDDLLRNLQMQNYHTVLNVGMAELVPRSDDLHYYGPDGVLTVEINAEMLLLTPWIRPLMPESLRQMLPAGTVSR